MIDSFTELEHGELVWLNNISHCQTPSFVATPIEQNIWAAWYETATSVSKAKVELCPNTVERESHFWLSSGRSAAVVLMDWSTLWFLSWAIISLPWCYYQSHLYVINYISYFKYSPSELAPIFASWLVVFHMFLITFARKPNKSSVSLIRLARPFLPCDHTTGITENTYQSRGYGILHICHIGTLLGNITENTLGELTTSWICCTSQQTSH